MRICIELFVGFCGGAVVGGENRKKRIFDGSCLGRVVYAFGLSFGMRAFRRNKFYNIDGEKYRLLCSLRYGGRYSGN